MDWIINGFSQVLTLQNILISFMGCFLGNLVGVLPGLGPTASIALLFPFVLKLPPLSILICLGAIYYGAMYGGSITSVLLNIPGEVASVPTAMDGYPLAKQGRAGSTLLICALCSFFGCMVALVCLSFFAPLLGHFALSFGPFEYFGLMVFSLLCVCGLTGKSVLQSLAMVCFGIVLSFVGVDISTSAYRLTFGSFKLLQGIGIIPIVVGVFGITEALDGIRSDASSIVTEEEGKFQRVMPTKREWKLSSKAAARGALIGTSLGILPGLTPSTCTFIAYSLNEKFCVEKDKYGHGAIEGCACAEAANNSAAMAGFIPLLALGIPTGPVLALVLAALIIQGVIPGPLMFTVHIDLTGAVIAGFFIGNIIMLIMNIPLIRFWVKIAKLPYKWLAPIILFLCMLGTFIIRYSYFDVWIMLLAGAFGFLAKKKNIPIPPLVLGLILGRSIEMYFRQASSMGFEKIFSHPIGLGAIVLGVGLLISTQVLKSKKKINL